MVGRCGRIHGMWVACCSTAAGRLYGRQELLTRSMSTVWLRIDILFIGQWRSLILVCRGIWRWNYRRNCSLFTQTLWWFRSHMRKRRRVSHISRSLTNIRLFSQSNCLVSIHTGSTYGRATAVVWLMTILVVLQRSLRQGVFPKIYLVLVY